MKFGLAIVPLFGALILGAIAAPPAPAKSKLSGPFCAADEAWLVRSDATETGDRYVLAAGGISMDGMHDGDLFGWSPKISIGGEVDGDVFAGANSIFYGDKLLTTPNPGEND